MDYQQTGHDIATIAESTPKVLDALGKIFPGAQAASLSRGESRVTDHIIADLEKIEAHKDTLGISDEGIAELKADVVYRHGHNENFKEVLSLAAQQIKPDANPKAVDPGWADNFHQHSEKAYDVEARQTWAELLAGEINDPGTFSRHTMQVLAEMGPRDAKAFKNLCTACVVPLAADGAHLDPVYIGTSCDAGIITDRELSSLEVLGVIVRDGKNPLAVGADDVVDVIVGDEVVSVAKASFTLIYAPAEPVLSACGVELSLLCQDAIGTLPGIGTVFERWVDGKGLMIVDRDE